MYIFEPQFLIVTQGGSVVKKSIVVAAAIAAFGFVNTANAADMPVKAVSAPIATAYNWTGWYFGLNAGGDWGTSDPATTTVVAGWFAACPGCVNDIANNGSQSFKTRGFTGGVHGGYNW